MKIIAAVDKNWGIGYKGGLLCSIPEDKKRFRDLTIGNTVIMGRKTLQSLPGGKILEGRENIVLSKSGISKSGVNISGVTKNGVNISDVTKNGVTKSGVSKSGVAEAEGAVFCASITELHAYLKPSGFDNAFVIGGQEIYELFINFCAVAYITHIDASFQADRYFPDITGMSGWKIENESPPMKYKDLSYKYVKYINLRVLSMIDDN